MDRLGQLAALAAAHPADAGIALMAGIVAAVIARRLLRGKVPADALIVVAAVMAQAVVMNGMWRFAGHVLHFAGVERVSMFGFLEVAMTACAVRARRNMRTFGTPGIEGPAVWALAALSGVFSALDASSGLEALFRLAVPLVAAGLWHRAIALEHREKTNRKTHWRYSFEKVLVRLGLADPSERDVTEVAAHRRIAVLARAAWRLRKARGGHREGRARRRLEKALEAAVEHAGLTADTGRQRLLLAQIGALGAADSLASLDLRAPWEVPPEDPARTAALEAELAATQEALTQALAMTGAPDAVRPPLHLVVPPARERSLVEEFAAIARTITPPVSGPETAKDEARPKPPGPPGERVMKPTQQAWLDETDEAEVARLARELSRNALADWFGIGRGRASALKEKHAAPAAANGTR